MKKFFRIAVIVIIAALVLATFVYLFIKSRPKEVEYEVVTPTVQTISRKTIATGKIEPRNEVQIKPQISGIISEIYFEAGAMVKKDDVIALVKVIPEMSQLNAAESNLNLAKIELRTNTNQRNCRNFVTKRPRQCAPHRKRRQPRGRRFWGKRCDYAV